MEKLIEREDIIENKNGKVMLNQKIEKENGIITFYCKYGTITQVTLTFDTDYIQYKGNYGSVRLVRYDDVITLAGKYYGFQASDTQGRIINSMFPVLQDVFEILIKELSYTPLDLSKIREKRLKEIERDEWSKNFLHSKVPIVIFLVILGILYAINCQFAFVITLMVVIFYLTNMLNNKKEEYQKIKIEKQCKEDPVYIVSRKIYHLAPSKNEYLIKQLGSTSSNVLINQGTPYEVIAIKDEIEERKNENIYTIVAKNSEQIVNYINIFIKEKMRPEMIGLTLENNFEKNFKYNEQEIKKISIKIENCIEQTFNKPYIKCLDEIKKGQRAISNVYAKDYTSSTQTNGLGFGIITNSTSNALLYQAMNNHEIEKQNKLNRMNYENNVIKSTGDVMLEKMKKVEQIYYNFGDEIIKTIQTILEN